MGLPVASEVEEVVSRVFLRICRFVPWVAVLVLNTNLDTGIRSMMHSLRKTYEVRSDSGRSMCIEKKIAGRVSDDKAMSSG